MTDSTFEAEPQDGAEDLLRAQLESLEQNSQNEREVWERRIILADMKVEALRAGIIDLDGLKFLDTSLVRMGEDGNLVGAAEALVQLKTMKPWLFTTPSSSSVARVPNSRPTRHKLATDMTDDEYRIARANIIRRSGF